MTEKKPTLDLIIDTETTGLAELHLPVEDPTQPHLLQLGVILADGPEILSENEFLLAWTRIKIPAEVSKIHGITAKILKQDGVSPLEAMKEFDDLVRRARVIVAHNLEFDNLIIRAAYLRVGGTGNAFQARARVCTMQSAKPVLELSAGPDIDYFKNPTLAEAYEHLVDKAGFKDAHTALVDARACHAVLVALRQRKAKLGYRSPTRRPPVDVEMSWVRDILILANEHEGRLTDWERSFVTDFTERSEQYADDLFVSEKQRAILVRIKDKCDADIPPY